MSGLSHIDDKDLPTMVDIGGKQVSRRSATAEAIIVLPEEVLALLQSTSFTTKKGAVIQTAIIAGIMAAKKTGELIPLCHSLGLDNCTIDIAVNEHRQLRVLCTASIAAKTGVEMEALTGTAVAALTIYDMCKALSHDMIIKEIKLIEKRGGKSDFKRK